MRCTLVLASIFAVAPALPAGDEKEKAAEQLFRDAMAKIQDARSIRIKVNAEFDAPMELGSGKGEVLLGEDGKLRVEMSLNMKGDMQDILVVSDGVTMANRFGKKEESRVAAIKDQGRILRGTIGRVGVLFGILAARPAPKKEEKPEPFNPDKDFAASNFKLLMVDKLDDRAVRSLSYSVKVFDRASFDVTLHLDAKTLLPWRRTIVITKGADDEKGRLVEAWDVTLNPKVDAKAFEVPAAK